jgi:two-component system, chemotaxis family, protein-glutamate methylesterase/glutaminase
MEKISVLIVDDSAVVRQVVSDLLNKDPAVEVIGCASDPIFAMKKMEIRWPDVLVLDIEMPRMDGITFLKKIMAERPTPTVICSSLTDPNSETMQRVLAAGAVEIVTKPKVGLKGFLTESAQQMIQAVKAAAQAQLSKRKSVANHQVAKKISVDSFMPVGNHLGAMETTEKIVAMGASTGGTQALEQVITALPRECPGIVIVQHMPEKFTQAFAQRLNGLSQVRVKEAADRDRVLTGQVLIAPGGKHLLVKRSGAQFMVNVIDGPLVNRHRPSVDVLFRSVAKCAGKNALGIIMTGMGNDGVRGLTDMAQSGATTIAQDENSCVVYGMPKEAVNAGVVDIVLPLEQIETAIRRYGTGQLHSSVKPVSS